MLKIKTTSGQTVFISHQAINEVKLDETTAEITTNDNIYFTKETDVVKSFLSRDSELSRNISHLNSALRDLHQLLRARLR